MYLCCRDDVGRVAVAPVPRLLLLFCAAIAVVVVVAAAAATVSAVAVPAAAHCSAAPVVAPAAAALRDVAATVRSLRHLQSVHAMDYAWHGQVMAILALLYCCLVIRKISLLCAAIAITETSERTVSVTMWTGEAAEDARERVQHAGVCHVMHESMWRIQVMLAG